MIIINIGCMENNLFRTLCSFLVQTTINNQVEYIGHPWWIKSMQTGLATKSRYFGNWCNSCHTYHIGFNGPVFLANHSKGMYNLEKCGGECLKCASEVSGKWKCTLKWWIQKVRSANTTHGKAMSSRQGGSLLLHSWKRLQIELIIVFWLF